MKIAVVILIEYAQHKTNTSFDNMLDMQKAACVEL